MKRKLRCLLACVWVGFFMIAAVAHAGGVWLYEQATPDMGVGCAGRQAAGFDASTASGNPAAMTRLDRSQMAGGIMGLYVNSQFDVKNSSNGDNGGGNAGYFSPVPTLYYVHNVNPDLKLGIGVGSYFGLGLNYSNEWAGKYYVQSASLTTAAVNPTIGYKVADWLSIGGGVNVVQGNLSERVAVNTLAEPGDGRLKYDASDVGRTISLPLVSPLSLAPGYDTSPTSSSSDRSPVLPLGATFRYSAGVQYDWSKDFSVGAAYTLLDAGSAKVNRSGGTLKGDLEGEYDTNFIHGFNLNFVYRF